MGELQVNKTLETHITAYYQPATPMGEDTPPPPVPIKTTETMESMESMEPAEESFRPRQESSREKKEAKTSWVDNFISWFSQLFGGKKKTDGQTTTTPGIENIGSRPRLPTEGISTVHLEKCMKAVAEQNKHQKDVLEDAEELFNNPDHPGAQLAKEIAEVVIYLQLIECIKAQKSISEMAEMDAHQAIMQHHNANKEIKQAFFDLKDEISKYAKTSEVLKWVNVGLSVGLLAAGICTAIFGFGIFLAAAGAGLAFASGGTGIANAIVRYKQDLKMGDLHVYKEEGAANRRKINQEMKEMENAMNAIHEYVKNLKTAIDAAYNAQPFATYAV